MLYNIVIWYFGLTHWTHVFGMSVCGILVIKIYNANILI